MNQTWYDNIKGPCNAKYSTLESTQSKNMAKKCECEWCGYKREESFPYDSEGYWCPKCEETCSDPEEDK